MKPFLATALLLSFVPCPAAPPIPQDALYEKGQLLFEDDFSAEKSKGQWHKVVPTFVQEDGVLKGTQTRTETIPASEGKPELKAHAAVHGLDIPTKDSIVACRIRFDGATMMDVEFDDRQYTGSHYGHICRAQVRPNGVTIIDERDGSMKNEIREMRMDPARKKEAETLLQGRQATFPATIEPGQWHDLVVETCGDEMRVLLDGKPAAYLKSPGIGHTTKSKIELGVMGQSGSFDDIKVWDAAAVKH